MILGFKKQFPWGDPTNFEKKILEGTKIHTIREDSQNKRHVGQKIHFATGVRTKNYNCFAEGIITNIEEIDIRPSSRAIFFKIASNMWFCKNDEWTELLAKNDGFDSVEDFWRWFKEPLHGKLIYFEVTKVF